MAAAAAAAGGSTAGGSGAWTGAGSQIGAAGLSMSGNIVNDILQNYYNKKAATKAYERTKEFWNMQNEYNSPKAQMARYAEAGLNPNLIYGSGSSSAGNSAPGSLDPSGTVATTRVPRLDALGHLAQVIALENAKKQGELLDTQKSALDQKIIESQAKTLESGTREKLTDIRFRDFVEQLNAKTGRGFGVDYYKNLYASQLDAMRARIQLMNKDMMLRDADLTLKGDVHVEKAYYNYLRSTLGVEKGDNIFIRAGMGLFNQAQKRYQSLPMLQPWFAPQIRQK